MRFKLSACWVMNKGLENEDRVWFFDNIGIDSNGYPLEIASPGAMRPAKPGSQILGNILNWNVQMRFNMCLSLEVIEKIKPEYVSQEIDVSEVYAPQYTNCWLKINIEEME